MIAEAAAGAIVVAGICLTARVASCIFEGLTESEREKQAEIRQRTEQFKIKTESFKADMQACREAALEEQQKYRAPYMDQLLEKQKYLQQAVQERCAEEDALWQDLNQTIRTVQNAIRSQTVTLLRKNSLERLLNQLKEAKERCAGYEIYLQKYQKIVNWDFRWENRALLEEMKPFEMCIPENFPYVGKIIWFPLDQFDQNGEWTDKSIQNIALKYQCDPGEFMLEETAGRKAPFMVERFDKNTYVYHVSLTKGRFVQEALRDTRNGVNAVVKRLEERGTVLCYEKKLDLYLPNRLSLQPSRRPPIRAELEVYPVRWEYGLKEPPGGYPVTVSEQREDAASSLQFAYFPLVFDKQQWNKVVRYLLSNHLEDLDDEWKVGPADENDIRLEEGVRLKFQFGDALVLIAQLRNSGLAEEVSRVGLIPFFEKMLPKNQSFSCDELFVDIDVNMVPVYQENLELLPKYVNAEELDRFLYDIMSELQVQRKNKLSMAGERYFQQWADVTQKLIAYLRKDHLFEVEIDVVTVDKQKLQIKVHDPEKLKAELEVYEEERTKNGAANHNTEYFTEDDEGEQCGLDFRADCEQIIIYRGKFHKCVAGGKFQFYARGVPIPELQQKQALIQLRSGRIANPQLQMAMMDGANIKPEDSGDRVQELQNPSIRQNEAQYKALCGALEEKNIFLIQGPPGTGKTTVIRELIQQYQRLHPRAHILVASQANVAVDNALSGLASVQADRLIRCGKNEKISGELQNVSIETRYGEYVEQIRKGPQESELVQKWMDFVSPQSGMNPNISELIIRNRPVVGATCVGLAKKRIGLERLKFDLVIVDEAGKALPGEVLIPILRARKLVLIGDHKQLPPVINTALFDPDKIELEHRGLLKKELFDSSFFQRLYERAPESNRAMLETQYRMPAVIGSLVSELFYDGKLKNGAGTENRPPLFGEGNLVMYDCTKDEQYGEEKENDGIVNRREAEIVMMILLEINRKLSRPGSRVAVITPYRGQNRVMNQIWSQHKKELEQLNVAINTIDAFQGDEAEIVIYCSTRAKHRTQYFSDRRRINVALSRAKNKLILVGSLSYFKRYNAKNAKKSHNAKKSPLPQIAQYVKKHGRVVSSIEDL